MTVGLILCLWLDNNDSLSSLVLHDQISVADETALGVVDPPDVDIMSTPRGRQNVCRLSRVRVVGFTLGRNGFTAEPCVPCYDQGLCEIE
jgi:hypothetical protein